MALLVMAACLPVVYVYQGGPAFYLAHLSSASSPFAPLYAQLWRFDAVFLLFFVVPAVVWKVVFRRPLAELGFRLGDWRFGMRVVLPALLILTPVLWLNAGSADFQAEYPMAKVATQTIELFVLYELAYALYYWGWEFLFRGALQLGLKRRLGLVGACMVQLLPSVLLHIGKPVGETWSAVAAAPVFGLIAVRSRSFVPLFVLHYAIGVGNDLFCAIRQGLL